MSTLNLIQIKRSSGNDSPTSLANGELAFSFTDASNSMFIGDPRNATPGTPLRVAGGKYAFLHQANASNPGTLTANAVVITNGNSFVNAIKANDLVIGPDGTTATTTAYVNGSFKATGNSVMVGTLSVYGNIANGTSANIAFTAEANGTSAIVKVNGGDGDVVFGVNGTANVSGNTRIGGTLTVNGAITFGNAFSMSGNLVVDTDTLFVDAVADKVGINKVPTVELDVSGVALISGNTTVQGQLSVTNTVSVTGNVAIDTNVLFVDTSGNYVGINNATPTKALSVIGQAEVSANVLFSENLTITQNTTSNNMSITNDLTVGGNLTVQGTLTTIDTVNLVIEDPMFKVAKNNSALADPPVTTDAVDFGYFGVFPANNSADFYAGIFRDASDSGKFKLFTNLTPQPNNVVDTADGSYTTASLVAHLIDSNTTITGGSITGITDLTVADGGTGQSSFTTNGVLYGNSGGALSVTSAGNAYEVLQVNAGGVPVFGTLDGGTF